MGMQGQSYATSRDPGDRRGADHPGDGGRHHRPGLRLHRPRHAGFLDACAVLDKLEFGLKAGGELDVTTTLCEEVRDTGKAIIIDCVSESDTYRDHHTPRIYGFESYISIPIFRQDGSYFGTLCGLDPKPARCRRRRSRPA
jgi:GAF domain-containing protein